MISFLIVQEIEFFYSRSEELSAKENFDKWIQEVMGLGIWNEWNFDFSAIIPNGRLSFTHIDQNNAPLEFEKPIQ